MEPCPVALRIPACIKRKSLPYAHFEKCESCRETTAQLLACAFAQCAVTRLIHEPSKSEGTMLSLEDCVWISFALAKYEATIETVPVKAESFPRFLVIEQHYLSCSLCRFYIDELTRIAIFARAYFEEQLTQSDRVDIPDSVAQSLPANTAIKRCLEQLQKTTDQEERRWLEKESTLTDLFLTPLLTFAE